MAVDEVEVSTSARLKVVGVGGAGVNAVTRMINAGLEGVEFVCVNTDQQSLDQCPAPLKVRIGTRLTRGLGAGGDPELGRKAAEEDKDMISEYLQETDMLFITAGMGGGTGTGASPVIAKLAREMGILTVAVVTKPFPFEGRTRFENAERGLEELKSVVDALIVIPNEKLLSIVKDAPLLESFARADEVLLNAVQGISELITKPGLINLDFADVCAVLRNVGGNALIGSGVASGEGRALEAAKRAISSPLMDNVSIAGSKSVLINITGGPSLTLDEVNEAANLISEQAGPEATIYFGTVLDEQLQDEVRVTVIASVPARRGKQSRQPLSTTFTQRLAQAMDSIFDVPPQPRQVAHAPEAQAQEDPPKTAPTFIPQEAAPSEEEQKDKASDGVSEESVVSIDSGNVPGLLDFSPDDYDTPAYLRRMRRRASEQ